MKHYKNILLSIVAVLLLSACGPVLNPYEENFRCRAKDDAGECIDTPSAYKKARYPEIVSEDGAVSTENCLQQEVQGNRYKILVGLLQEEEKPMLQLPKILRVLLLPYEGEDKELFMTRYVYLEIEDSSWILTNITEN